MQSRYLTMKRGMLHVLVKFSLATNGTENLKTLIDEFVKTLRYQTH